jgi:hypothetical protein
LINFSSGSSIQIRDNEILSTELRFITGQSGRTVMLTGIPTAPSGPGTIYVDNQGYLRVS